MKANDNLLKAMRDEAANPGPEAAIHDIIEAAVCWISDDADHPDTPPKDWQVTIQLLKAAPQIFNALADLLTDINLLASQHEIFAEVLNSEHGKAAYAALREARGE